MFRQFASQSLFQARRASTRTLATATSSNIINIVEVAPRDGLQNEKGSIIPVDLKASLVDRLVQAGITNIEAGSFVSPKWVPQMAGTAEVLQKKTHIPGIHYAVLIPNSRGLSDLLSLLSSSTQTSPPLTDEISIFTASTDAFAHANLNCSISESLSRLAPVASTALSNNLRVRGYISVAIVCPYTGKVDYKRVREIAKELIEMGCYEVSLGDTVGQGTPFEVQEMIAEVSKDVPVSKLAGHFHDTYGTAVANVLAALNSGIRTIDTSVGGLGGCPYSPGATGNVATEDVLYALQNSPYTVAGTSNGTIDLNQVVDIGWWISEKLGRESVSRVGRAIRARKMREEKEKARSKL